MMKTVKLSETSSLEICKIIGFAIRSRATVIGYDSVLNYKKHELLILANASLSERTINKLKKLSESKKYVLFLIDNFKMLMLKANINVLGVTNSEMTKRIIYLISNFEGEVNEHRKENTREKIND